MALEDVPWWIWLIMSILGASAVIMTVLYIYERNKNSQFRAEEISIPKIIVTTPTGKTINMTRPYSTSPKSMISTRSRFSSSNLTPGSGNGESLSIPRSGKVSPISDQYSHRCSLNLSNVMGGAFPLPPTVPLIKTNN